jgi:hypothetical protein
MNRKILPALMISVFSLIWLTGCNYSKPLKVCLTDQVEVPPRRAIVFLADGMRADLTSEMIDQGKLPNIKKYLVDRGCVVENGVSTIPSITYAAIASITTGRHPGHHDVPGNKWFDRTSGKYQNYTYIRSYQTVDHDMRAPTIYEILNDKYTVTIQTAHRRGADRPIDNWMSSGINWFFGCVEDVDRVVARRFDLISECAAQSGRWPDFILAYFPAIDEIGHRKGSDSPEYEKALINLDGQIGRICRALEANCLLDDTYLVLVSDHGHDPMKPQCAWIPECFFQRQLNIPVIDHWFLDNKSSLEWHKFLKDYRVVLINGGTRRIAIHLRSGDSWTDQPSFDDVSHFLERNYPCAYAKTGNRDLLNLLTHQPGVGIVTAKMDADTVLVLSAEKCGQVSRRVQPDGTKTYSYQAVAGDPLGYRDYAPTAKMVGGKFYDSQTWLNASCESEYPDFVPQIVEMFDSPRAGQIVAFAASGWSFCTKNRSGHGSVIRADMIVPFIIAGPNISRGSIKTARLVDLMPTVLDMLGELDRLKTAGPIDGRSLLPEINASPTTQPVR